MFTKSLIAAAAIASVMSFAAAPAQAETNVDFNIGFGFGDGFHGGGYDGYEGDFPSYGFHGRPRPRPIYHGVSCGEGRNVVREAGFRRVTAFDCSAPVYGYKAWRHGDLFKVKVNSRGNIISVRPVW